MSQKKKSKAKATKPVKSKSAKAKNTQLPGWFFRKRSKQDGRSYGNAALYATPQTVESLVRETGQNSLDAAAKQTSPLVAIRYRLIELPAGCNRRDRFLNAIRYQDELAPHLSAVAKATKSTNTGARIKRALSELDAGGSTLWLLAVEDYGATGLEGDEFHPDSKFCALIRDVENSRKENEGAGGSFGLGSKTLWSCSNLLTVLFASEDATRPDEVRLIGKADLGFHEIPSQAPNGFVGHGHFGISFEDDGATSQWLPTTSKLLGDLCLDRESPVDNVANTGTTALIVAFDDPETEDDDAATITNSLREAVARNFWPAIVRGDTRVFIRHERADQSPGDDIEVDPAESIPSLVDAFRKHLAGELEDTLEHVGDVVSVPVTHTIPATRSSDRADSPHGEIQAEARLIIRLAGPGSKDARLVDSVALVRGRSMVVQYLPRKGVALGARPFHAMLAAGALAGDTPHQRHAENFLRYAEPPAHDCWKMWPGLKARYEHGAGARLNELLAEVTKQLREFVGSSADGSEDIPEVLRDIFRIADVALPNKASYKLAMPTLRVEGDVVHVSCEVECPDSKGHKIRPVVSLDAESGSGVALKWTALTSADGEVAGDDIKVPAGVKRVSFSGSLSSELPGIELETCAFKVSVRAQRKDSIE